jgi:hypothetical protein
MAQQPQALYTTDEVRNAALTLYMQPELVGAVWETVHHSTGTSEEDQSAWFGGDQGMLDD